ncbi:MAG: tetratricopeptide repeat protein [Chthoniobacterales bacterium]
MPKKSSRVRARAAPRSRIQTEYAISAGICVFLVAIVWAVFGQTLEYTFLNYDDDDYVYANPNITRGLTSGGLRWAFTHVHANNWHPLTTLSHMLDCQLYGLQPWGPHLSNVLLHAAAAILLFLVLRNLTGTLWRSAFVAVLFAIHPLRAESVAWISERKDVLSGVFFMLTLWSYGRYARSERHSSGRYLTVLVFFALGLMCKPTLVTLPFVLLLLDYWPLQRLPTAGPHKTFFNASRQLILEKVPFFVLTAASCVVTILAQEQALERSFKPDFGQRIGNAVVSYAAYLGETIYPMHLAVLYPYHPGYPGVGKALLAFLLLLAITVLFFAWRKRYPYLFVGWLWFLGMLVPMIGIVQVGLQSRADRYTYLPQIGLCIAATWGAAELFGKWRHGRAVSAVTALLLVTTLGARTYDETSYWRNSETLWNHAIENTSGNPVAQTSLGTVLLKKGDMGQAARHYQEALKLEPDSVLIHSDLGKAFEREGRIDEAMAEFQKALQLKPDYADGFYDLGNACMDKGQIEQAISYYERAVQIKPELAGAYNNLGNARLRLGQLDEAIANYRKAIALRPDLPDPRYNLGNALSREGNLDEAIASYEAALRIRPKSAIAHNRLGVALAAAGRTGEALEHLEESLRLDSNNPETHRNLANVLARLGRRDEAVTQLTEALRLRPGDTETMEQLHELEGQN